VSENRLPGSPLGPAGAGLGVAQIAATGRPRKSGGVIKPTATRDDPRFAVLLVDNRDIVHIGLRVVLRRQPWVTRVLSARRGADAVLIAARHEPKVALVDLFVGEEWGTQVCAAIRARAPGVPVLLTSSSGSLTQHEARAAGAAGFIAKDCPVPQLLAAIRAVAQGAQPFLWRPEVARGSLTVRQRQILDLMAEGATNRAIADALGLSVDTVKHHATLIYRRLDVRNRAGAVHLGQRLGLLSAAGASSPPPVRASEEPAEDAAPAWPPARIAA
jgi:DNA-binding NarL/FixJ family response regulator